MNKIHRKVWNVRRNAFMVVAENTRSCGKSGSGAAGAASGALLAAVLLAGGAQAQSLATPPPAPAVTALPTQPSVVAGAASVVSQGSAMTVTQSSDRAAINWQSFNIGRDASVQFVQPGVGSVTLNRVTGNEGSVINGALRANGQVFLLNPNGVLFNAGARVDTAGLLASSLNISDADFMAGRANLNKTGTVGGAVINRGSINSADGGYVALIGAQVKNDGVISATLGNVTLAAGNQATLNFNGDSLVGVVLSEGALDSLVANGGAIRADGGQVLLTAKAASGLLDGAVNNTSEVRARTIAHHEGRIVLLGDMQSGTANVAGTLDASAPDGGNGGFIETSAANVKVADDVRVTTAAPTGQTGTWLIDPTDFNIGAGAGTQSASGIGATTLETALGAGNVTIQTVAAGTGNGDINVNAPVTWSANKLTLEAHGDINVNAVMTASGTSSLDLKTGYNFVPGAPTFDATKTVRMGFNPNRTFAGRIDIDRAGSGILSINNEAYTLLNSLGAAGSTTGTDLQGMGSALSGRFALASNIDAADTSNWNSGAGFIPIGSFNATFDGRFDGLGHTISNLFINDAVETGLFGAIGSGTALRNVAFTGATVSATRDAGVLVGRYFTNTPGSTVRIDNVHVAGTLNATGANVGGLLGNAFQDAGPLNVHSGSLVIKNASAAVAVTKTGSPSYVGGLIGGSKNITIKDSFATGNVSALAGGAVGGLAGYLEDAVVDGSYATGNASGLMNVGGLVGEWVRRSANTSINVVSNSYAQGAASSTDTDYSFTGGLIGSTYRLNSSLVPLTITGSHATGNVTSVMEAGGLLGGNETGTVIVTASYASGAVTSSGSAAGGLIGQTAGGTVSGSSASGAVVGKQRVGGLVGEATNTTISSSTASGSVTSAAVLALNELTGSSVGGLVGKATLGSIADSSASGRTEGQVAVGGLVGSVFGTTIIRSAASGNVVAGMGSVSSNFLRERSDAGGLVGLLSHNGSSGTATAHVSFSSATGNVTAQGSQVGGLIGYSIGPNNLRNQIADSQASGAVSGMGAVGGLIGMINLGDVLRSSASGTVVATFAPNTPDYYQGAGGLIGMADDATLVSSSRASGASVHGAAKVGGLIGNASGTQGWVTIEDSESAVGSVSGYKEVGGLVGIASGSLISKSFSTTQVLASTAAGTETAFGGLVGRVSGATPDASGIWGIFGGTTSISDSYARGSVAAPTASHVGGLIGRVQTVSMFGGPPGPTGSAGHTLARSYSSGAVSGASSVGGLIGSAASLTVSDSFWDVQTSGLGTADGSAGSAGGTGKTTVDMNANALFTGAGWDFTFGTGVWGRKDSVNEKYPVLRTFGYSDSITVNLGVTSRNYGDANPSLAGLSISGCPVANCSTFITGINWGSALSASTAAGSYAFNGTNVLGFSFGGGATASSFDISYTTPNFTITPRPVNLSTFSASAKVYDRTDLLNNNMVQLTNTVNGDVVTMTGQATLASANAGVHALAGPGSISLSNPNYTLVGGTLSGTANVYQLLLDLATVSGATRVYDGGTQISAAMLQMTNVLSGDVVNLAGTATLASKNAGNRAVSSISGLTINNPNYTLEEGGASGTVAITARPVSVATVSGATRVYDSTTSVTSSLLAISNVAGSDTVALTGTAVLAGADAGSRNLSSLTGLTLLNDSAGNYTLVGGQTVGSVNITPLAVQIATASWLSREYDRTALLDAAYLRVTNLLGNDSLTLTGSGLLASANVGSRGLISLSGLSLGNNSAGNYTLQGAVGSGNFTINPAYVFASAISGATKVYDASATVGLNQVQLTGVLQGDTVNLGGQAGLSSANAGTRALRAGSLTIDNPNYFLLTDAISGTVLVTARPLTLAALIGASRVYDGTTFAAASLLGLGGVLTGDTVSLNGSALLASANVGAQSVSLGSLGLSNANYTLLGVTPTGTIRVNPRPVTLAALFGASKVYDRSTTASSSLLSLGNVVGNDSVTLSGNAVLAGMGVGAQALSLGSLALSNGNYTLQGVAPGGTVQVTPRTLQISVSVADKTFDGSAAANASYTDNRLTGDLFSVQGSAAFVDQNAGTAKPVTVTGLGLTGADAANYQISAMAGQGTTGNLALKPIIYTLTARDPARLYAATGGALVSTAQVDQLVLQSWAGTVAGTSAGQLSYTIFKAGVAVTEIKEAGIYEIRASFTSADAHYVIDQPGSQPLTVLVRDDGAVQATIAQVQRIEVPTQLALSTMPTITDLGASTPAPRTPNVVFTPPQLLSSFGNGVGLTVLSAPRAGEPADAVTLTQARSMLAPSGGAAGAGAGTGARSGTGTGTGAGSDGMREVRVPVSRNSLAEIVNGGVRLPDGVEQVLFVVTTD